MEYIDLVNIEKKVVSALNFGILKYLPRGILLSKTSFLSDQIMNYIISD